MIIKNMRWGYDGGGIGCGPVEGNTLVELKVVDETTKHVYFVLNTRMAEFNQIMISEVPMFDIMMEMADRNVNFDYELDKIRKAAAETYDFEISDSNEYSDKSMLNSRFSGAIELVLKAMKKCYSLQKPDDSAASRFIEKYIGKDTSECTANM